MEWWITVDGKLRIEVTADELRDILASMGSVALYPEEIEDELERGLKALEKREGT